MAQTSAVQDPVLVETFVEVPRFTGGVYRASGRIASEPPRGADAMAQPSSTWKPTNDVWLSPLAKHWRRILHP